MRRWICDCGDSHVTSDTSRNSYCSVCRRWRVPEDRIVDLERSWRIFLESTPEPEIIRQIMTIPNLARVELLDVSRTTLRREIPPEAAN